MTLPELILRLNDQPIESVFAGLGAFSLLNLIGHEVRDFIRKLRHP